MIQLFNRTLLYPNRWWLNFTNLDQSLKQQWNRQFQQSGLNASTASLIVREGWLGQKQLAERFTTVIHTVREQAGEFLDRSPQVHIIMLADEEGRLLDVMGDEETLQLLNRRNIGSGTSFAMKHTGINAISASMETGRMIVVDGAEHHLKLFAEWTCICAPVMCNSNIVAYLDMSFGSGTDVSFAALLLRQIIKRVETELLRSCPDLHKEKVHEQFNKYGLTPREKEIGYRWLNNQPTAQISAELFISEGTVRNMIKKVYAKTQVHDKGRFIRKFLR